MPRRALRLVVPAPDRRRVLARPNGLAGWTLPTLAVDDATAWTASADADAHRLLGGRTAPVRRLDDRTWELELLGRLPAAGNTWIAPPEARRLGADADVLLDWADDTETPASPHLRPGWRTGLDSWLDEHLDPTGPVEVLRHWELAAVVQVPTASGPAVVKEGGVGFTGEAAVVAVLDGLPGAPAVLATDGPRFASRWAGETGAASPVEVAAALGRLQRAAVERVPALRDAGCPRAAELAADTQPAVAEAFETLAALGLPDTVVHGDAHTGNAVGDGHDPVLVDWSDATIGCPAVDLDLLCRSTGEPEAIAAAWARAFGHEDPGPIVAALPAIRVAAAGLAVALHHHRRPHLPASVHGIWDGWTRGWAERLDAVRAP